MPLFSLFTFLHEPTRRLRVTSSTALLLQTQHPEALVLTSGYFNHVTLDKTLAALQLYVDFNTRGNRTIDLMYANVKDAYSATLLPALGKADHSLVLLKPAQVRRLPATTRSFRKWSGSGLLKPSRL